MDELNNISRYQKDIELLENRGTLLLYGLYNELSEEIGDAFDQLPQKQQEKYHKLTFREKYNEWYNESLVVLKQLMPERLDDFISYYKLPRRKEITVATYTITDYLLGLQLRKGNKIIVSPSAVIEKYKQQVYIIESLKERFKSSLYNIKQLLQADIFDSELDTVSELCKKGFYRAAGAVCGVVIEKHLQQVAISHNLRMSKKHPTINDYNDLLKSNDVIDIATFRRIQLMGDIRNECDHNKDSEPKRESIEELIDLTKKLIKSVY